MLNPLNVADAYQVIKVQEAKEWQTRPGTPIRQQEYDWTWGTDYAGSCYWTFVADGWSRVRMVRLRDQYRIMPANTPF